MFPEDKHLETYLVSNQKTTSSPPVANITVIQYFGIIAISIPISIAVSLTLFETLMDANSTFEFNFPRANTIPTDVPTRSPEEQLPEEQLPEESFPPGLPIPTGPTLTPEEPSDPGEISPDSVSTTYIDGYWIHIPSSCNGFLAGGANFRVSPSLDVSAIKGVVLVGDRVFLTGQIADGDGIIWYRAVNEAPLESSIEHGALNILAADQEGWIANCFVE